MNCPTGCSTFGSYEVSFVQDSESQRERERVERVEIKIENSRDQATTKKTDIEDFILCVIVTVILRVV
jgi:hypothetical protein